MVRVRTDDVEYDLTSQRGPGATTHTILSGRPTSPDNFELALFKMSGGFATPRHRHNFDQFRYVTKGTYSLSPTQDVPTGWLAYVSEGTFYGPQEDRPADVLNLQLGGASGHGFLPYADFEVG